MAYATQQDMLDQEGNDTVFAAFDRDRDGVLDNTAISDALDNASAAIDSYLSMRFDLPIAVTIPWAKRICIDLAIYFGSRSADALTKELKTRYDDGMAFLKDVAAGKAGLGVTLPNEPAGPDDGLVKCAEILIDGGTDNPRAFSRTTMSGL